jgi:hypothetical protein
VPLQAVLVFAALAVYFAYVATDPLTQERGHRWNLFKLAKWGYPVFVALPFVGLYYLTRRLRVPRGAFLAPGAALLAVTLVKIPLDEVSNNGTLTWSRLDRPEKGHRELQRYIRHRGFDRVFLASHGHNLTDAVYAAYLLAPLRHLNGWREGYMRTLGEQDLPCDDLERTLVVTMQDPPFEPPQERLPFKLRRLDGYRPHLFWMDAVGGLQAHPDGGRWAALSAAAPATLHLFSPRAAAARLTVRIEPATPEAAGQALRVTVDPGGKAVEVRPTGAPVEIEVPLAAGRTRARITAEGAAPGARWALRHAEVHFADAPPSVTRR